MPTYKKPPNISQEVWDNLGEGTKEALALGEVSPTGELLKFAEPPTPEALPTEAPKSTTPPATATLPEQVMPETKVQPVPAVAAPKEVLPEPIPTISITPEEEAELLNYGQTNPNDFLVKVRDIGRSEQTENVVGQIIKQYIPDITEEALVGNIDYIFGTDEQRVQWDAQAAEFQGAVTSFGDIAPEYKDMEEEGLRAYLGNPAQFLSFLKSKPAGIDRSKLIRYVTLGQTWIPTEGIKFNLQDQEGNPVEAQLNRSNDVVVNGEVVGRFNPDTGEFQAPSAPLWKKILSNRFFPTNWAFVKNIEKALGFATDVMKTPSAGIFISIKDFDPTKISTKDFWANLASNPLGKEFMGLVSSGDVSVQDFAGALKGIYDVWQKDLAEYEQIKAPTFHTGWNVPDALSYLSLGILPKGELTFGVKGLTEFVSTLPLWMAAPTANGLIATFRPVAAGGGVYARDAASAIAMLTPIARMETAVATGLRFGIGLPAKGLNALKRKQLETTFDKGLVKWQVENGIDGTTANRIVNEALTGSATTPAGLKVTAANAIPYQVPRGFEEEAVAIYGGIKATGGKYKFEKLLEDIDKPIGKMGYGIRTNKSYRQLEDAGLVTIRQTGKTVKGIGGNYPLVEITPGRIFQPSAFATTPEGITFKTEAAGTETGGTKKPFDLYDYIDKAIGAGKYETKAIADNAVKEITPVLDKIAEDMGVKIPKGEPPLPKITPASENPVVKRFVDLIRKAKPTTTETEAIISQQKKQRVAIGAKQLEAGQGEEAFLKARGALKGEYERAKPRWEPFPDQFAQQDIDELMNIIKNADIEFFHKIRAQEGLTKLFLAEIPQRNELALLEQIFGKDLVQAILDKRAFGDKAWDEFLDASGLFKSMSASADLSFPFRQGLLFQFSHPIISGKAYGPMIKAFASESTAQAIDTEIRKGKWFKFLTDKVRNGGCGYDYTEWGQKASTFLEKREEQYPLGARPGIIGGLKSTVGAKIASLMPWIRAGERAFAMFGNKVGVDLGSQIIEDAIKQGRNIEDPAFRKGLGQLLNWGRGRGTLGPLQKYATLLNVPFFSPRLIASRVEFPLLLVSKDPMIRKEAWRAIIATMGTLGGVMLMADYFGVAHVELDPRSSDFAKIRMGKQRVDPWGGYQPLVRFIVQTISGQRKQAETGETYDVQRRDIISNFIRSKESPFAGLIHDIVSGQSWIGEDTKMDKETATRIALEKLIPMWIGDIKDALKMEGIGGAMIAVPTVFGVGVQTYGPSDKVNRELLRLQITKDRQWDTLTDAEKRVIYNSGTTDAQSLIDYDNKVGWESEGQYTKAPKDIFGEQYKALWATYHTAVLKYGSSSRQALTIRLQAPKEFQDAGVEGLGWKDYFPDVFDSQRVTLAKQYQEYFALKEGKPRTEYRRANPLFESWLEQVWGYSPLKEQTTTGTTRRSTAVQVE